MFYTIGIFNIFVILQGNISEIQFYLDLVTLSVMSPVSLLHLAYPLAVSIVLVFLALRAVLTIVWGLSLASTIKSFNGLVAGLTGMAKNIAFGYTGTEPELECLKTRNTCHSEISKNMRGILTKKK